VKLLNKLVYWLMIRTSFLFRVKFMKANIAIQVKQSVFPAGTVGGQWLWQLTPTDGVAGPAISAAESVEWLSDEPFTSVTVEPETTYKVSGVRVDPNKEALGQVVSTSFTTETNPVEVLIDTANSISVELV